MRTEHDRGNAVLVILAVVALAAACTMALARMAVTAAHRDDAQTAADAAALAATTGGRAAAERLATANGAVLMEYRRLDRATVEVVVRCAGATATARATRAPERTVAAYTRDVDDGQIPSDEADAPSAEEIDRDPEAFPGRRPSVRQQRTADGGHPAARQRQRTVPPPPMLSQPEPSTAADDLDRLLDKGPVVLPQIVPAEQPDEPPTSAPALPWLPESPWSEARDPVAPPTDVTARAVRPTAPVTDAAPRVRRVTRVIRHVDTWSVFKVALVFNLFFYVVLLTAGVLLWQVAQNTGTVDNVERFFENFGWQSFQLKGGEIFHNAWVAGLFILIGMTGLAVLLATLFNLITDLVGGIRVSVLEEEVVAREDRGVNVSRIAVLERLERLGRGRG